MWAVGRTVNASSSSDVEESLSRVDADEQLKEAVYVKHATAARALAPEIRFEVERFLGQFPDKSADAERMKLYVHDFERLARLVSAKR